MSNPLSPPRIFAPRRLFIFLWPGFCESAGPGFPGIGARERGAALRGAARRWRQHAHPGACSLYSIICPQEQIRAPSAAIAGVPHTQRPGGAFSEPASAAAPMAAPHAAAGALGSARRRVFSQFSRCDRACGAWQHAAFRALPRGAKRARPAMRIFDFF